MAQIKYRMVIQWSDEDNCFLAALPDFPGQYWRTHGDTYEEAVANGKEAIESGFSWVKPTYRVNLNN